MRLSPSALNLLNDCARCFWLDKVGKVPRPRGIFPSLPGGMDRVIKVHFDEYRREAAVPPALANLLPHAELIPSSYMNKWRNWRSGLSFKIEGTGHIFGGALDDGLWIPNPDRDTGKFAVVDYKTRGSEPKEPWEEYMAKYYGLQMSCYRLMLEKNGHPTVEEAYIVAYYPELMRRSGIFEFREKVVVLKTDINAAEEMIKKAVNVLDEKVPPKKGDDCEYCARELNLKALSSEMATK